MISEALRLLRVFHDLKQKELAEEVGVSRSYISELEKGNRTPSLDIIEKYARYFSVPASSIMFFAENIDSYQSPKQGAGRMKSRIAEKIIGFLQVIERKTEPDIND